MNDTPAHVGFHWARLQRADALNIPVLFAAWVAMVAAVDQIAEFPLNDDWIYAGSAKSVAEHAWFWIPGPATPDLLPQAYWGALFCLPFGFSFTALRLSTLILGLAGIIAFYFLLRRIGATPLLAFLGAAAIAANPVWFNVANGFMTDVPFLTVTILAVLCLVRGGRWATPLGFGLALIAILIRQTGLFLLLGYAVAYPVARGFRPMTLARGAAPALVGVVLHLGFQHWMIANGRAPDIVLPGVNGLIPASIATLAISSTRFSIVAVPYLGLFAFPFIILTGRMTLPGVTPRRERAARVVLAGMAVLFFTWIEWKDDGMPVLLNLMHTTGVGPLTLRDTLWLHINEPVASPATAALWLAANAIGVAGAFLLLDRLVRAAILAWSAGGRPLWLFTLAVATAASYWAGIMALACSIHALFDRYILVLLPWSMIAVMACPGLALARDMRRARLTASVACLLAGASFGIASLHDYIAWNRARWRALDDLVEVRHVPPVRIDGGYEFNGWMYRDPRFPPRQESDYWWRLPGQEYLLGFGPMPGYREVGRYQVDRWMSATVDAVLVLHRNDAEPRPGRLLGQ
jgi:hypothetical protein